MTDTSQLRIFDADNHFYETQEALTRYLPSRYRDRIRYVDIDGRTKIAINGQISDYIPNPTFDVVARPGAHADFYLGNNPEGKSQRELTGKPMRSIPAFREPGPRLAKMDEFGVDASLMFPSLLSVLEQRMKNDLELTHAAIHAANEWMHEVWSFSYQNRIFAVPAITLAIVDEAVRELDWVLERGAKVILVRPAPVPGPRYSRSPGLPEFDPFWARVQESGVLVCFHNSDSGYNEYVNDWEGGGEYKPFAGSPFVWATLGLGKRPIEDLMTALICHGALARHPGVRVASVENGSRWIPQVLRTLTHVHRMMPQEFAEHPIDTFERCVWVNPFWEEDPREVLDYLPVERFLFGSDYPHPEGLAEPRSYLERLADLPPSDVERIMGGNLAALLGVDLAARHLTPS